MCLYPIRLENGSSGPYAENAWTARFSGPRPTWRRSYSISSITIMSIARMLDAKGTGRCRVPIAHEQFSVVIDGRSIVEAYTKPRLPRELSNSPPTGPVRKNFVQPSQLQTRNGFSRRVREHEDRSPFGVSASAAFSAYGRLRQHARRLLSSTDLSPKPARLIGTEPINRQTIVFARAQLHSVMALGICKYICVFHPQRRAAGLILADCGMRLPLHREFLCHGGFEPLGQGNDGSAGSVGGHLPL